MWGVRAVCCVAAQGLRHMHKHRTIHFDLKPSNLLLGDDGCIKIADLGIAVFMDAV